MPSAKHKILFEHLGENSNTAKDPVAVWENQVDLETEKTCCFYWDDDRPVTIKRYEVREVELPEWLPPDEWIRNRTAWKWFWGFFGCQNDLSPEASRKLAYTKMTATRRFAMAKLLKTKKFRSSFRASLRRQLEKWLDGESDHENPFSPKQWICLVTKFDARRADQLDSQLYYGGRYE